MAGMAAYEKTNPLCLYGDFADDDATLLANAAACVGISIDAARIALPLVPRMRKLAA